MDTITYTRGTTYNLTHTYAAPTYLGAHLIFTVKNTQYDTDETDTTNAIMTPKVLAMSGSTFPQTTAIVINPTDVAVSMAPSKKYYWSIKVFDTNGQQFLVAQGTFVLSASTTNETTG